MTHWVEMGGQQRPIRFGMAALYKYEQITGRSAISDFAAMQTAGGAKITTIVDLIGAGLFCGYSEQRMAVDFTELDVADWIGQDQALMDRIMELFADSFPSNEKNKTAPQLKKAKAEA